MHYFALNVIFQSFVHWNKRFRSSWNFILSLVLQTWPNVFVLSANFSI